MLTLDVKYIYDPLDRRIGATTLRYDTTGTPTSSSTTFTTYDGLSSTPYADFDASGQIRMRYLWLNEGAVDELLARLDPVNGPAWYLTDNENSIHEIVDPSGNVLDRLSYDPFGQPAAESSPQNGDRFKYAGGSYDPNTGLIQFGLRYYDPYSGRWISQDPGGYAMGDSNLYRYVGNSPTSAVDPSGLFSDPVNDQLDRFAKSGGTLRGGVGPSALGQYKGNQLIAEGQAAANYVGVAANQVIWSDYADEKNALGTSAQLLAGALGLDLHSDILDFGEKLDNWEWSWAHAGKTLIASAAVLPILGLGKYLDEVAELGQAGKQSARGVDEARTAGRIDPSRQLPGPGPVNQKALPAPNTNQAPSSTYRDVTGPGSLPNRATNATKASFEKNLDDQGFSRSVSKDGKVTILQKDGAKYILRDGAKSTGGPTADYYKPGSKSIDLKIRLEDPTP